MSLSVVVCVQRADAAIPLNQDLVREARSISLEVPS